MARAKKNKKQNQKNMLEALRACYGIVSPAAQMAGISRTTHYLWMDEGGEYAKAVEEISEIQLDFVESKLLDAIDQGKEQSIKYYLSCKGKSRGYRPVTYGEQEQPPGIDEGKTVIMLPHNDRDDQKLLDTGTGE